MMGVLLGKFFNDLIAQDGSSFRETVIRATGTFMLISVLDSLAKYLAEVLAVRWRRTLTCLVHGRYVDTESKGYYWVCAERQEAAQMPLRKRREGSGTALGDGREKGGPKGQRVDNPDQRIAADCRLLCETLSKVFVQVVTAPAIVAFHSLYSLRKVTF